MTGIELATIEDIPRLNELLTILFTQEADFLPDPVKQSSGLQLIIETPLQAIFLYFGKKGLSSAWSICSIPSARLSASG
ncbi:MAG: hypothetical protein PHY09_15505 [Desulfuromonadaceae bacterium]|nr:hypothetical protein [Desulfuromonadaceae bacterium]MDD5105674.1 hypothetical protein [Desulfuromonadaceae bacterium]